MSESSSISASSDASRIIKKPTSSINQSKDVVTPVRRSAIPLPRPAIKRSSSSNDALSITPSRIAVSQEQKEPASPITPDTKKVISKRLVTSSVSPSTTKSLSSPSVTPSTTKSPVATSASKLATTTTTSSLAAKRTNLKPNLSIVKPGVRFGVTTDLSHTPASHRSASPSISRLPSHRSNNPSISISRPSHTPSDSLSSSQSLSHIASEASSANASAAHTRSNSLFTEWEEELHSSRFSSRSSSLSSTSSLQSLTPSETQSAIQSSAKSIIRSRTRSSSAQIHTPLSGDLSPLPLSPYPYHSNNPSAAGGSPTNHGKKENIHVFVRCRPFLDHEPLKKAPHLQLSGPSRSVNVTYRGRARQFTFDGVFDQAADQSTIYQSIAAPLVEQALSGYNATIFAYGQTSSGKSYTMLGSLGRPSDVEHDDSAAAGPNDVPEMGIIPRAVRHIFDFVDHKNQETLDRIRRSASSSSTSPEQSTNISPNTTITQPIPLVDQATTSSQGEVAFDIFYTVSISYLEIYNEKVSDLLGEPIPHDPNNPLPSLKPELEIREQDGTFFAPELTRHVCMTRNRLLHLIERGNNGRNVASTSQNARSSRSHAILTLYIDKRVLNPMHPPTNQSIIECSELLMQSKLNLVDLAGSERLTSSTKVKQGRETLSINLSLSCLSNVIMSLTENLLPSYRDSKLTRLLKDSLGGSSKCCMIACISPNGGQSGNQAANQTVSETVSTLRWAERAKRVKNQPLISDSERADARLIELKAEVQAMRTKMLGRNKDMIRMLWMVKSLTEDQPMTPLTPMPNDGHDVDLDLTEAILMDPFSHPMAGVIVNDSNNSDNEEDSPIALEETEPVTAQSEDESIIIKPEEECEENRSELPEAAPAPILIRERSASHRATNSVNFFKLFKQTMNNVHHQIKTEIPAFDGDVSYDHSVAHSSTGSTDLTDWKTKYEHLLHEYEMHQKQCITQSTSWDSTKQQLLKALEESELENATLTKRLSDLQKLRAEKDQLEYSITDMKESHLNDVNTLKSLVSEWQSRCYQQTSANQSISTSSQKALTEMKQLINEAQQEVYTMRQQFHQVNHELSQQQQRNHELTETISDIKSECDRLIQEAESRADQISQSALKQAISAETRCDEARAAVSHLVLDYQIRYDEFSTSLARCQQEKLALLQTAQLSQAERSLILSNLETLAVEKSQLEATVEQLQVKVISAEIQAAQSSETAARSDTDFKQQLSHLKAEFDSLKQDHMGLTEQLVQSRADGALLQQSVDSSAVERIKLQESIVRLQDQIACAEERSERATLAADEMRVEYEQRYAKFEADLEQSREHIQYATSKRDELLDTLSQSQHRISHAEQRANDVRQGLDALTVEYNQRFADFDDTLDRLNCLVTALAAEKDRLTDSLILATQRVESAETRADDAELLLTATRTQYTERYEQFSASLAEQHERQQLQSTGEANLVGMLTAAEQRAEHLQNQANQLREEYQANFHKFDASLEEHRQQFDLLVQAKAVADASIISSNERAAVAEERSDRSSQMLDSLRSEYESRFKDFDNALSKCYHQMTLLETENHGLTEQVGQLQERASHAESRAESVHSTHSSQLDEYRRRFDMFQTTLAAYQQRLDVVSAEKTVLDSLVVQSNDRAVYAEQRAERTSTTEDRLRAEYRVRFVEFDSELSSLNQVLTLNNSDKTRLEQSLQDLQRERDAFALTIDQMRNEHEDLAQSIDCLNAENEELHLTMSEVKRADVTLQERLDTTMHHSLGQSSHIIQLQDELSAARKQISELVALSQASSNEARETEASLRLTISQTVALAEQQARESVQQGQQQAANSITQYASSIASERASLHQERDILNQTINDLRHQNHEIVSLAEQNRFDKEQIAIRVQELTREVVDLKQSIDQLNQENVELSVSLEQFTKMSEEDKALLTESLHQSTVQQQQLAEDLATSHTLSGSLQASLDSVNSVRSELESQLKQSVDQSIKHEEQLSECVNQNQALQRELSAARSQLVLLESTIQSINQSISDTAEKANSSQNQLVAMAEQRADNARSRLDAVISEYKQRFIQFEGTLQTNKLTIDQLVHSRSAADARLSQLTIEKNDAISVLNERVFELQTKLMQESLQSQQDKIRLINQSISDSSQSETVLVADFQSELAEKNSHIAVCEAELASTRGELVDLQSASHSINEKVLEHQSTINTLSQQLSHVERTHSLQIETLNDELTQLRQQLDQATSDRASIDAQCRSLRQQLLEQKARRVTAGQSGASALASMELAVKTDQLAKSEIKIKDLFEKLSETTTQVRERDEQILTIKSRVTDVQCELKQARDQLNHQTTHTQEHMLENQRLNAFLLSLQDERDALVMKEKEHLEQISRMEIHSSALLSENNAATTQITSLLAQLDESSNLLNQSQLAARFCEEETAQLHLKLAHTQEASQKSLEQISKFQDEIMQLNQHMASLKTDLDLSKTDCAQQATELVSKTTVIAELNKELLECHQMSSQLTQQHSADVINLTVQSDQLAKNEAKISMLQNKLREANDQIHSYKQNQSQIDILSQRLSQQQNHTDTLSQQLTQQSVQLDKESRTVKSLQTQLDHAVSESTRKSIELADCATKLTEAEASLKLLQHKLDLSVNQFVVQSAELAAALEMLSQNQTERDNLSTQIADLNSRVEMLSSELVINEQRIASLSISGDELRTELDKALDLARDQSEELQSKSQQLLDLESTVGSTQAHLEEQISLVQRKNDEILSLSLHLSSAQDRLDQALTQANSSLEKLGEKCDQVTELARHIVELEAELADEQSINESLNQLISEKSSELSTKTIQLIQHDAQIKALQSEIELLRVNSSNLSSGKLNQLAEREAKLHTQIEQIVAKSVKKSSAADETRRENQTNLLKEIKRFSDERQSLLDERTACQTLIDEQTSQLVGSSSTIEQLQRELNETQAQLSMLTAELADLKLQQQALVDQSVAETQLQAEEAQSKLAAKEREYKERYQLFDRELADVQTICDAKIRDLTDQCKLHENRAEEALQGVEQTKLSFSDRYSELEVELGRWKQLHQGDFCSKTTLTDSDSVRASDARAEQARSRLAEVESEYAARYQQFEKELTRIQQASQSAQRYSNTVSEHATVQSSKTVSISNHAIHVQSINWEQRLIELREIHGGIELDALHALIDEQRTKLDETINQLEILQEQSQNDKQVLQAEIDHLRATAALVCAKYEACVASKLELVRSTSSEVTRMKEQANRASRRRSGDDIEWKEADDPCFNINRQSDAGCIIS